MNILFSIIDISDNYVFEDELALPPESPGKSCRLSTADSLHIVLFIGKYTDNFFLGVGGSGGMWEDFLMEKFFVGEGDFPWRGSQITRALFKNGQKSNIKNKYFQLKVRSNIKT